MPAPRATPEAGLPDAAGNWADRLPRTLRPYARLARWDRPIGWQLLMWPCWWGVMLAAVHEPGTAAFSVLALLILLALGAIAMRGAGCAYNDLVDRDLDAKVARTRHRPLASGQVGVRGALAFIALQLLAGLAVLLALPGPARIVALASLVVVAAYPFAKRVTNYPQGVLGLAFSWGVLVGWVAVAGALDAAALILFLAGVLWVVGYDTVYAHQDREDDAMVGIGSTALAFGPSSRAWLAGLYAGAVFLIGVAIVLADAGPVSWIGLIAFAGLLGQQVVRLDIDDPALCLALFKTNHPAGAALFAGLAADGLLALA